MSFDVIIDGANISHITSTEIVAARIENAIDGLSKFGLEAHVIFPQYMYEGKSKNKKLADTEVVDRLCSTGKLSLVNGDDDAILISAAYDANSFILSNDSFSDHKSKKWCTPEVINFIDNHRLTFSFVDNFFIVPLEDRCKIEKYRNTKIKDGYEELDVPVFKARVSKDPNSYNTETHNLPKPVNRLLEILNDTKNHRLSDVSSRLKNETGYSINDLFGKSKIAVQFLEICGFQVSKKKDQFYVTGCAAA